MGIVGKVNPDGVPMPNIKPNKRSWPRNVDDMRRDPSCIVTLADLSRLRLVHSYDSAKRKLPAPLKLPTVPLSWEARTILHALGLSETPSIGAEIKLPAAKHAAA